MWHLTDHAEHRASPPGGQLLRYRRGTPITTRRYDHLWTRLGTHLPWLATQQITTHWLRHTTLTWVERTFGYATARAYAGHHTPRHGTTATYVKADLFEIATALSALTQEPHPLLLTDNNYAPDIRRLTARTKDQIQSRTIQDRRNTQRLRRRTASQPLRGN